MNEQEYKPLSEAELVELEQRLQGVAEDFPKSKAVEDVSRLIATIRELQGQVEKLTGALWKIIDYYDDVNDGNTSPNALNRVITEVATMLEVMHGIRPKEEG